MKTKITAIWKAFIKWIMWARHEIHSEESWSVLSSFFGESGNKFIPSHRKNKKRYDKYVDF